MKFIFKIEEYLSERNSIVIKACRLHSHKPIDDYFSVIVDMDRFNFNDDDDIEDFIDTMVNDVLINKINSQDQREPILESNIPDEVDVDELLNYQSLVGKTLMGKTTRSGRLKKLKMRRVHL